jgi:hypothetical protein
VDRQELFVLVWSCCVADSRGYMTSVLKAVTSASLNKASMPSSSHKKKAAPQSVKQDIAELSAETQLAVLEEIAELPPFGFHLEALLNRLEARLQLAITVEQLQQFLGRYYDLNEWRERFVDAGPEGMPKQQSCFQLPSFDNEFGKLMQAVWAKHPDNGENSDTAEAD